MLTAGGNFGMVWGGYKCNKLHCKYTFKGVSALCPSMLPCTLNTLFKMYLQCFGRTMALGCKSAEVQR